MKYPNFLKENDKIGLLATSCGSNVNPYRLKTKVGIENFLKFGYQIKRGHRVFAMKNAISAPHPLRARDFNLMYKNKNISFLWSTGGGEIMMGMLPYIDFEKIKKLPAKYFMGFSDNTNLTFTLTTICDVATIYATSISLFSTKTLSEEAKNVLALMRGEKLTFNSYPYYDGPITYENKSKDVLEEIKFLDINQWQSVFHNSIQFKGRIIGGCLDVLISLCGTKYDKVQSFIEKYQHDGIIWYFDPCDLTSTGLYRALFQLKEANWFKHAKGFLIGRCKCHIELLNYTYKQAIIDALSELNLPILYDVDISHISPSIPIINGAIATITYQDHQGKIDFELS